MAVGLLGFVGTRLIHTGLFAEGESLNLATSEAQLQARLETERREPRFVGDRLGVYLAPPRTEIPGGYRTYEEICGSAPTVAADASLAGELDLSLSLPPKYTLLENSPNTGVVACEDQVFAARWNFAVQTPSGYIADIVIGRTVLDHDEIDTAATRVKVRTIGEREAILVEPVTSDGRNQHSAVIFPEPFGTTFIHASDLPRPDLLQLARIVAEATK
jgi:hypothetical protein